MFRQLKLKLFCNPGVPMAWQSVDNYCALLAPQTCKHYCGALRDLCKFLMVPHRSKQAADKLLKLTTKEAGAYLAAYKKTGVSEGTFIQRFSKLHVVYKLWVQNGLINQNPFDPIQSTIKYSNYEQVRPTQYIGAEQIKLILDKPSSKTKEGVRDRALLALLFGTGARVNEVLSLELQSLRQYDSHILYVHFAKTKTKKPRDVALAEQFKPKIMALIRQRQSEGAAVDDKLFSCYIGRKGRPTGQMKYHKARKIFLNYTGLPPHTARASVATKLLKDIRHGEIQATKDDVQAMLGHTSERMTNIYNKRIENIEESAGKLVKY